MENGARIVMIEARLRTKIFSSRFTTVCGVGRESQIERRESWMAIQSRK
jgi:hypothetical protein